MHIARHAVYVTPLVMYCRSAFCHLYAERARQLVGAATQAGALAFLRTGVLDSVPMQVGKKWRQAGGLPLVSACANDSAGLNPGQPTSLRTPPVFSGSRMPPPLPRLCQSSLHASI